LPIDYDESNLIDVSAVGDVFATFMNPETGEWVKCADFYNQYIEESTNVLNQTGE